MIVAGAVCRLRESLRTLHKLSYMDSTMAYVGLSLCSYHDQWSTRFARLRYLPFQADRSESRTARPLRLSVHIRYYRIEMGYSFYLPVWTPSVRFQRRDGARYKNDSRAEMAGRPIY